MLNGIGPVCACNRAIGCGSITRKFCHAGADASWELDLFGRALRSIEAASAEHAAAATDTALAAVRLYKALGGGWSTS